MNPKPFYRRTTLTEPHSPKTTNAGGNAAGVTSSNGSAHQNPVNGGSSDRRAKSRLLPTSGTDNLLKPPTPAWKLTRLSSGTQLHRRPPSIQGRAASPLQAPQHVARLKKEVIGRRTDLSPAPSRPPRGLAQHSLGVSQPTLLLNPAPAQRVGLEHQRIAGAFQPGNDKRKSPVLNRPTRPSKGNLIAPDAGAAPQSSPRSGTLGVGRHKIVLDVKRSTRQAAERRQLLEALPSTNKVTPEDTVRRYKELCEALGQTPQDAWIAAVLEGANEAKVLPGPTCSSGPPAEVGLNAGRRDKVASPTGDPRDYGRRKRVSSNAASLRRRRSVEEERKGSSAPPSVSAPSLATQDAEDAIGVELGNGRVEKDTELYRMVAYCQHLQPYLQKMKLLRQRGKDVQEALDRFLMLCRSQPEPGKNTSKYAMTALESHANSLTDGIKELQRRNVALLLRLTEYSREVRRPLGSVGGELETAVAGQKQQQQPVDENQSETKRNENRTSLVNTPLAWNGQIPLGRSKQTASKTASVRFPSTKEPPPEYLGFLREEEGRIVQQLNEVCLQVREALTGGLAVTIADEAMLKTPLFLPSASTNHSGWLEKAQPPPPQKVAGHCVPPGGTAGPGVVTVTTSARDSVRQSRGLVARNTGGSVKGVGKKKSEAGTDDNVQTTPPERAVSEEALHRGPFVGVAPLNWMPVEEGEKNVEGANGSNNCFSSRSTGSPQLVLGGGRRYFSLYAPPPKMAGGNVPVPRSKSTSACNATRKVSLGGRTRSATKAAPTTRTTMKQGRNKAPPQFGTASGVTDATDAILAAHIKEAGETWEAIKGLASIEAARTLPQVQLNCAGPTQGGDNDTNFPQNLMAQEEKLNEDTAITPASLNVELENTIKKPQAFSLNYKLESTAAQSPCTVSWAPDVSTENEFKKATATGGVPFLCSSVRREEQESEGVEQLQGTTDALVPLERAAALTKDANINVAMATRIQCCWRQHKARTMLRQRRRLVGESKRQRQHWHIENVMAFRLQRAFAKLVARRRWQREAMQRQYAATSVPQGDKKMADDSRTDSNKENRERPLTLRERFEQVKEIRRNLLRDAPNDNNSVSCMSSTPCSHSETVPRVEKRQKPVSEVAVKVPPLDLKSSGISTLDLERYPADTENFDVNFLNRLLRAPRPLLYVLRVMCDACPVRPASALAFLEGVEGRRSKRRSQNSCDLQTPEAEEEVGKKEKKGKCSHTQPEEDREGRAKGKKGISEKLIDHYPHQDMMDENETQWDVQSYRKLHRRLLARKAAMIKDAEARVVCPFSIHVKSLVEEDEMLHEVPLAKGFQRPFECWGTAYAFQVRVFSAAAEYAWKLIFSHTPRDDYRQRMLKTKEKQEARLKRVEQRNRKILACYCVRSEREWLKKASEDLGFIARIYFPRSSLDPNDPDFERDCRETYEDVEDFLYQCFPAVTKLERVPTFLMGAGIFFLLKSTFACTKETAEDEESSESDLLAGGVDTIHGGSLPLKVAAALYDPELPLTAEQRETIFTHEMLNLLEDLFFSSSAQSRRTDTVTNSNSNHYDGDDEEKEKNANSNNNMGGEADFSDTSEGICERVVRSLGATTRLGESVTFSVDSSLSEIHAAAPLTQRPRLRQVRTPPPEASAAKRLVKAASNKSNMNNIDSSLVGLKIVFPKGYLVDLSERLMRALFGLCTSLEACEDLDATL
ncbi:uncharacterized protein Tco025E_06348 [Trypanosoma conorhini]|uniref:Uncharacterized protein n=1 Tax=Trypanosoma conorhini TaxID=83891 RepID=A0A422P6H0_9TRYP|nr:uncharacterized protein Tco025E_06348 [Trypanosoma conorhini]RNF13318.1 hypothetical protein Tco025E_06348 [Trypanosoma conorhini]